MGLISLLEETQLKNLRLAGEIIKMKYDVAQGNIIPAHGVHLISLLQKVV